MVETIWDDESKWPLDRRGFVFLARAVHRLGAAMYAAEWTGDEPKAPYGLANGPEDPRLLRLNAVHAEIARRCEAEALIAVIRHPDGQYGKINSFMWQAEAWKGWFDFCDMNPWQSGGTAPSRNNPIGHSCPIFIQSSELEALIAHWIEARGPKIIPNDAPWRVRPNERQNAWIFRQEVIAEADRRAAGGGLGARDRAMELMAAECSFSWKAESIGAARRAGK